MRTGLEERLIDVGPLRTHYFAAGAGPPLVLLHGDGDSAASWQWVQPALARTHRVYAPSLPGCGDSAKPDADYSQVFFTEFVRSFLDALGIERATLVGNSLGGLIALRLACTDPSRVTALVLVDSSGLGREVNPGLIAATLPGYGELAVAWARTPLGAFQRAWLRAAMFFERPHRVPAGWIGEQFRLALLPGFLGATLAALRAQVDLGGQREIWLNPLAQLDLPTLVVWGERDSIVPYAHARAAAARLRNGRLESIPECGHLPQVEQPERFVEVLEDFLASGALASQSQIRPDENRKPDPTP